MSRPPAAKHPRQMRKPVSRTPVWVVPAAVVAGVALLVAAFLVVRWYTTPVAPPPLKPSATQVVVSTLTGVSSSELESVGAGTAHNLITAVSGAALTGPNGRPEVFYYGAEYCPYCGAQRWPMIVALSRFGTFSGLTTTSSSSTDVYPNTPTFTFHNATYTSQYIEFASVETTDRNQQRLETPTQAQLALVSKYDTSGSIPFIDIGNRYVASGAMYLPDVLSGMSWQAVADAVQQPDSAQAKAILGSANLITASICRLTADQPASVCSGTAIQAIEKKLG
jgi:hypothetical protein